MDWADIIEREIEDEMNNSVQCEQFISLPHGRVAAELRIAKAEGYLLCGKEWADTSSPSTVLAIAAKVAAIKQGE